MSIYSFLTDDSRDKDSCCKLPDHDTLGLAPEQNWVAGAYEALIMRSMHSIRRPAMMNYMLARKVRRQILNPSDKNREMMCVALLKTTALPVVDALASHLTSRSIKPEQVSAEARYLATETDRRELVKVGVALLGVFGTHDDFAKIIAPLGMHEEFTFYAAPAACLLLDSRERNDYLLKVASETNGWGKTAALYELDYEDERARDFLLRHGCANSHGLAINANLCATKGDMLGAVRKLLAAANDDEGELYRGICDILTGLTAYDGVHDSFVDYKYHEQFRQAFVELTEKRADLCAIDARTGDILLAMK